jgi:hypothetical protein
MNLIKANIYSKIYSMATWPSEIFSASELCQEVASLNVFNEISSEEKQRYNVCLHKFFELNKYFYKKSE